MRINGVRMLLAGALALGAFAAPAPASSLMAAQPDGKIVVGGKAAPDNGFVARLNPDGNLDPTFGRGGVAIGRRIPPVDTLAVQPDGRIVVAAGPWLVRYEADGTPDSSFIGTDTFAGPVRTSSIVPLASGLIGVVRHNIGKGVPPSVGVNLLAPNGDLAWPVRQINSAIASDMIQLSNGALALSGHKLIGTPILTRLVLGVGHRDSSFGPELGVRPWLLQALTEHRGEIYTAGNSKGADGLVLTRFTANGELDPEFGSEGLAEAEPLGDSGRLEGTGIQVQVDGKVVVVAEGRFCSGCPRAWLARFDADGELDESFGEDGFAYAQDSFGTPLISRGKDVVLLPGGRSLVLGTGLTHGVVLAAFDSDGDPDRSWGNAGVRAIVPTCGGDVAAQRARGCLPSARVRLRVRHLRGKRSILNLRVRPRQPWSRIASVRLLLPRALRIRPGRAGRIVSHVYIGGSTAKGDLKTGRRELKLSAGEAHSVQVRIPRAVLRRSGAIRGKRKLPFRLWVEFGRAEGTQRLVLRRPG